MIHILMQAVLLLAFSFNLFFIIKKVKGINYKKNWILISFFLIGAAAFFYLSQTTPIRGGYDNDHDFGYLSKDFFNLNDLRVIFQDKEISPLIFDSITNHIFSFSLKYIVWQNLLLMFISGLLLYLSVKIITENEIISLISFLLFCFNFLTLINANTLSTTPANIFYVMSAIYSLFNFYNKPEYMGNFLWSSFSILLLLTGRYEFFLPLFPLYALLSFKYVIIKKIYGRRGLIAFILFSIAIFLFSILIFKVSPRNYPPVNTLYRFSFIFRNFNYQLGENNLYLIFNFLNGKLLYLISIILIFMAYSIVRVKDKKSLKPLITLFIFFWLLFFSAIFQPMDLYPLHFARHHLYFFIPFIFFLSISLYYLYLRLTKRYKLFLSFMLGLLFCFYLIFNIKALRFFDKSFRTNDIEWNLLIESQDKIPQNCSIYYPFEGARADILNKYFNSGKIKSECIVKYVSPELFIFKNRQYAGLKKYLENMGSPIIKKKFFHKFYTVWDSEEKDSIHLDIGFYK